MYSKFPTFEKFISEKRKTIGDTIIDGEYIEIIKSTHASEDRHGMNRQRNIKDSELVDVINRASNKIERRKKNYLRTIIGNKWVGIVLDVKSNDAVIITLMIQLSSKKPPFNKRRDVIAV